MGEGQEHPGSAGNHLMASGRSSDLCGIDYIVFRMNMNRGETLKRSKSPRGEILRSPSVMCCSSPYLLHNMLQWQMTWHAARSPCGKCALTLLLLLLMLIANGGKLVVETGGGGRSEKGRVR